MTTAIAPTIIDTAAATQIASAIATRVAAAWTRARERRAYRQMLGRDDTHLSDMGVTRAAVRQALLECGRAH